MSEMTEVNELEWLYKLKRMPIREKVDLLSALVEVVSPEFLVAILSEVMVKHGRDIHADYHVPMNEGVLGLPDNYDPAEDKANDGALLIRLGMELGESLRKVMRRGIGPREIKIAFLTDEEREKLKQQQEIRFF